MLKTSCSGLLWEQEWGSGFTDWGREVEAYACHMSHGLSLHNSAIAEKQNLGLRSTVFIRLTALGAY